MRNSLIEFIKLKGYISMKIAIRKEPNGSIYIDKTALERFDEEILKQPPYNYSFTEIERIDCEASDFNDDLIFNLEKYNARKQKEIDEQKIAQLKQNLLLTDYIANKLSEAIATSFVTGDNSSVIALRNKYFNILADRDAWREEINRLEEELNNGNIQ